VPPSYSPSSGRTCPDFLSSRRCAAATCYFLATGVTAALRQASPLSAAAGVCPFQGTHGTCLTICLPGDWGLGRSEQVASDIQVTGQLVQYACWNNTEAVIFIIIPNTSS
jgi:hypothetical protein